MNNFAQWYIQHSKKLSIWGAVQWCIIAIVVLFLIVLAVINGISLDEYVSQIVKSVITWSATLGGVTIASYMGNSAVQKYAENKFKTQFSKSYEDEDDEDQDQQSSNG